MKLSTVTVLIASTFLLCGEVLAQDDIRHIPLPKNLVERVSRDDFSGRFDGDLSRPYEARFRTTVRHEGAPWLRLNFADYDLGKDSYIIIRSGSDGGYQRLDARSIKEWGNSSAFFNGDAVEMSIHVAPGDRGVFFRLASLTAGRKVGRSGGTDVDGTQDEHAALDVTQKVMTCNNGVDDRTPSSDPAVGRLVLQRGFLPLRSIALLTVPLGSFQTVPSLRQAIASISTTSP